MEKEKNKSNPFLLLKRVRLFILLILIFLVCDPGVYSPGNFFCQPFLILKIYYLMIFLEMMEKQFLFKIAICASILRLRSDCLLYRVCINLL